jgi:hypothetical protein
MSEQRWFARHISPFQFARWYQNHPNNAHQQRSEQILDMVNGRHWYRLSKGCFDKDNMNWLPNHLWSLDFENTMNLFKAYVNLEEGDYLWVTDPTIDNQVFTLQQSLDGTDKTQPMEVRLRQPRTKWTLSEHDTSGNYRWSLGINTEDSILREHYAINWESTNYK